MCIPKGASTCTLNPQVCPSEKMRGHRDTRSDEADAPVKTEAEPGETAAAEDATGATRRHQGLEGARQGCPLVSLEGAGSCLQHLDSRLVAPRAERECVAIAVSHQVPWQSVRAATGN